MGFIAHHNPFVRILPVNVSMPLHVLAVTEHGRMSWQKASGYNERSKVEAAMSRYKRVIGDTLKSRQDIGTALVCRAAVWQPYVEPILLKLMR
jgi:hypothetical protein